MTTTAPAADELVRGLGVPMAVVDPGGVIVSCNAGFAVLLGLPGAAAAMGRSLRKWLHVDVQQAFSEALRHQTPAVLPDALRVADDGNSQPDVALFPFDGGCVVQLSVPWRSSAPRPSRFTEFVAGVAHEINNPLQAVLPALEEARAAVLTGEPPAVILDLIEQALIGSRRIHALVEDLRTFRATSHDSQAVDVNEVTVETIRLLRPRYPHVRLSWDLGVVLPAEANAGQLGQVLLNLVANAAAVMDPTRGRESNLVIVRTWSDSGSVFIRVIDNGPGIPPEIIDQLFDPFVSRREGGTGLGLTVCHNLVTGMGGHIEARSRVGAGTTVEVRLSAAQEPVRRSPTAAMAVPTSAPTVLDRILIVDDEPMVRRTVRRVLRNHAHDVMEFSGGIEVIEWLKEGGTFDLMLCDRMMSRGGGAEVLAWMRAHRPEDVGRVAFMTGASRGKLPAGVPLLLKPFSGPELLHLVSRMTSP